ncbi:MAG: hypothetical protein ACKO3V_10250 [Pirellula sp.]
MSDKHGKGAASDREANGQSRSDKLCIANREPHSRRGNQPSRGVKTN